MAIYEITDTGTGIHRRHYGYYSFSDLPERFRACISRHPDAEKWIAPIRVGSEPFEETIVCTKDRGV